MSNGSSRVLPVLVALVVGVLGGWLLARTLLPPPPPTEAIPKGTSVILVGPKASDLTIPKVKIGKMDGDVLFWVAKKKSKQLWIELDDDLFENTIPGKYARYRVQCQGRWCFSGEIKSNAPEKPDGSKYLQVLIEGGIEEKADGWIIINP
jgi:hypothetical protein